MNTLCSSFLSRCLQVPRVDVEAVKGKVLRVSNRSCESVALVGNTLECTVPFELQSATRELEVEVRNPRRRSSSPQSVTLRRGQINPIGFPQRDIRYSFLLRRRSGDAL